MYRRSMWTGPTAPAYVGVLLATLLLSACVAVQPVTPGEPARPVESAAASADAAQASLLASLKSQGPAPELTNQVWINSEPLTLADLRGNVVIIEFWTYG